MLIGARYVDQEQRVRNEVKKPMDNRMKTIRELGGEFWAEIQKRIHDGDVKLKNLDIDAENAVVEIMMGVLARHEGMFIKNDADLPVAPLPRGHMIELIDTTHFQLSGYAHTAYESAAEGLLGLYRKFRLRRLLVWDYSGEVNETFFRPGTDFSDVNGIIEFDFAASQILSCEYELEMEGQRIIVIVTIARKLNGIGIDGDVPLQDVFPHLRDPVAAFLQMGEFLAAVAAALDARVMNVANEYETDDAVLPTIGVFRPVLCGAWPVEIINAAVRERLDKLGAVVQQASARFVIVWIRAPELIVKGYVPDEADLADLAAILEQNLTS